MLHNTHMPIKDPTKRKEKQREYAAKYYINNREKVMAAVRLVNNRQKEKWAKFKASLSCAECGFTHSAALDFHHIDPATKIAGVQSLVQNRRYSAAYREVGKCTVLCANCHRLHHHNERVKG